MNNHINILLTSYKLGSLKLNNRIVMSPMTRSRAVGNVPNELMATYYSQRASAGLIITEGTSPSPNGLGYARIPGIFTEAQVEGWSQVTQAVHEKQGRIFLQLMHTGRITHPANLPDGAVVLAPSAIKPAGQMWTDALGLQEYPVPKAMTFEEIRATQREYIAAAENAIQAGFDGVELHGANGYLIEQFLSPHSNQRTDGYGGNLENRSRFLFETVQGVIEAIGKEKTGLRLSPYGVNGDMHPYEGIDDTYKYLAERLNKMGLAYLHLADHSSMGAPEVPLALKIALRKLFKHTLLLSGGYDAERAQTDLQNGFANLITFGRPFINNPDLVERITYGWPLSLDRDHATFYTPGEKGYTDYPQYALKNLQF